VNPEMYLLIVLLGLAVVVACAVVLVAVSAGACS